jgi:hypothetical protein
MRFTLRLNELTGFEEEAYVRKIRALGLAPGYDYAIEVRHDSWCKALEAGFCNCDPDVIVRGRRKQQGGGHE